MLTKIDRSHLVLVGVKKKPCSANIQGFQLTFTHLINSGSTQA
jgi:hypothetical protein